MKKTESTDKVDKTADNIPEIECAPVGAGMIGAAALSAIGEPAPPPTLDEMKCLKGPCRHYWHLATAFPAGNPEGTPGSDVKQHHHTCLVNRGMETNFEDDCVFECNLWDPLTPKEIRKRDRRRARYQ